MSVKTFVVARLEKPMGGPLAILWTVVSIVIVAVALTWCVGGFSDRAEASDESEARTSLHEAAGPIVTDVFSVDSRSWETDREKARAVVAPPLSRSSGRALTQPPPTNVGSVSWVPEHVAVVWADADAGEVLMVVDVSVTSRSGHVQKETKSVQTSFVRHDGKWLLSGLEELQ